MKVPPKRKGNYRVKTKIEAASALNESPSEKEGKSCQRSPSTSDHSPSMKVPPKRKGNPHLLTLL